MVDFCIFVKKVFCYIYSECKNVNIIDWVDASSGDIRADVFRTYLLYAQSHIELAEMYLQIYCNNTDLTRGEIFQWAPIIKLDFLESILAK